MGIKLEPRKTTDRGWYLTMPLYENIPQPKDPAWKLTVCPVCGQKCWERPLPEGFQRNMFSGQLCTRCAIRKDVQMEHTYNPIMAAQAILRIMSSMMERSKEGDGDEQKTEKKTDTEFK